MKLLFILKNSVNPIETNNGININVIDNQPSVDAIKISFLADENTIINERTK